MSRRISEITEAERQRQNEYARLRVKKVADMAPEEHAAKRERDRLQYQKHREKRLAKLKKAADLTPEDLAARHAAQRQYYLKHRDERRAKMRAKYDPDVARERNARITPEKRAEYSKNFTIRMATDLNYATRRRRAHRQRQLRLSQDARQRKQAFYEANREQIEADRAARKAQTRSARLERQRMANRSEEQK